MGTHISRPSRFSRLFRASRPSRSSRASRSVVDKEIKELRQFGLIVGGIFALIGLWPLVVHGTEFRLWAIVLAVLLIVPAVVFPRVLWPIHRVWMFAGHWLGWINTRILLGILFYGIVTPMGMVRRLWVKDAMDLQFRENADSYRRVRQSRPGSHMWHPF